MTVTAKALEMQIQLKQLMRQHGITPKPVFVPLAPPQSGDDGAIDITGYASTTDIDLSRQKFRAYAFNHPCLLLRNYRRPPLLYRHNENQIAGTVANLSYDSQGNLKICAEVRHAQAARCNAFSIGARVLEYEIRDADNANFHAEIIKAEIIEVSLTDAPANPQTLVRSRHRAAPVGAYLKTLADQTDLTIRRVKIIQRQFELLHAAIKAPARTAPRPTIRRVPISAPRRPTPFSSLVEAINR